jgi:hypothetical protein
LRELPQYRRTWQAVLNREIGHGPGKENALHDDSFRPLFCHRGECGLDFVGRSSHHNWRNFYAGGPTSEMDVLQKRPRERIERVGQNSPAFESSMP